MTEATAQSLLARLSGECPRTIVDIGCGWAELLLRLLVACPAATGLGIDHDEVQIGRARAAAADRGVDARASFRPAVGDPTAHDLAINVGAEHVFGTLDDALAGLWPWTAPGGKLLLGTQFWEQTPPDDVVAQIGELPDLAGLLERVVASNWRALDLVVATAADWDSFEFGFMADWEQCVLAAAPEASVARQKADDWRDGYLRRRGVLGFAYLLLGRPVEGS